MTEMHDTPTLPGTSPVTDNPNPGGTQGSEPAGPGTDLKSASSISGQQDSSAARGAGEPEGRVYFRCGDVGNTDCRWETRGQTEDELRPRIHQHLREAHGQAWDDRMRSHIKDAARERAA